MRERGEKCFICLGTSYLLFYSLPLTATTQNHFFKIWSLANYKPGSKLFFFSGSHSLTASLLIESRRLIESTTGADDDDLTLAHLLH